MKVIILGTGDIALEVLRKLQDDVRINVLAVSYTHLRAHET